MMHENFLVDAEKYDAAELYWKNLFDDIQSNLLEAERWEVWFNNVSRNGIKLRNGNPILTKWNPKAKRGLRIIQEEAEYADEIAIGAWLNKFDDHIDELVISCVLSDKTEIIAKKLIEAFILQKLSLEKMQALIDELLD